MQLTKHGFSLKLYHLMLLEDARAGTEHDVGQEWSRKDRGLAKKRRERCLEDETTPQPRGCYSEEMRREYRNVGLNVDSKNQRRQDTVHGEGACAERSLVAELQRGEHKLAQRRVRIVN